VGHRSDSTIAILVPEPYSYRDFSYPLNVFMHILTLEEGEVRYLHYGLFQSAGETIADAQERAAALLLTKLPPPPARILDAGTGLGTTLARLVQIGYDAEGITPDERQIAAIRSHYGDALRVQCARFENFNIDRPFDAIVFHESSQYIDSEALFAKAERLAPRVLVLDEFALGPVEGLHRYGDFLAAAQGHHFALTFGHDVSKPAAPTIDYFMTRLPRYRDRLIADLGLTSQQVDDLVASGERYRDRYRTGAYAYRLLCFEAESRIRKA
jgi:SAM-dependent methyltransferase